jgi:hypothetical protein
MFPITPQRGAVLEYALNACCVLTMRENFMRAANVSVLTVAADWLPKRSPLRTPLISRARAGESMPAAKHRESRGLRTIL